MIILKIFKMVTYLGYTDHFQAFRCFKNVDLDLEIV